VTACGISQDCSRSQSPSDPSPKTIFVIVCRQTATPVLLLCLITFKQSFNESMLFCFFQGLHLHYCKVSTIYIYSVIADCVVVCARPLLITVVRTCIRSADVANRQTDRRTDKHRVKHNLLGEGDYMRSVFVPPSRVSDILHPNLFVPRRFIP